MWTSQVETFKSKGIQKISIFSNNQRVTYSEVIELWQDNNAFRSFFSALLAETSFSAYFWETPPITLSTAHRAFEFALIDSPQLARVRPNPIDFRKYFESASSDEQIITFPNLGKDALLVVPCPIAKMSVYPHIGTFMREAHPSQKHALWQTVGQVLQHRLNQHPIWVSTSGLGVYWLHIRLDSYPKYYNFESYKI